MGRKAQFPYWFPQMSRSEARKPILVRGARQLLTLRGPSGPRRGSAMRELGLFQDGALLISDGVIQDVGPSRRVENLAAARDAEEISADGRVVMPGFVDSYAQLVCGPPLLDEYESRILSDGGSPSRPGSGGDRTIQALRAASKQRLELDARKTLREFIRNGATAIGAATTADPEARSEMKALRVIAALNEKPLDLLPALRVEKWPLSAGECEPGGAQADILETLMHRRLARFVIADCGQDNLPPEDADLLLKVAAQKGFYVGVATDRFASTGGVRVAVANNGASVSHLTHVTEEDIDLLAHAPTVATLLPGAVFHSGLDRYPPARALIDAGAAVALASGFSCDQSPTCSMAAVISLACNLMRMTPAEAISAATINGAHALRSAHRFGSLEYGKEATLLMLNASDYREIPYHFGMNLIAMCMKRGDVLFPRMAYS
ncbi:MAG: amidohydrolase family protein [Bryobacteraceae bacterium]|nr:amidohydrolase family protein [Bryobacteraceae bacterium]